VATIITKNGSGSAIPASLTQGELAINVDSGTLYYGSGSANAVRTITASLALSASYVTGSIFNSTNLVLSASYALTASFALNGGGGGGASFSTDIGTGADTTINVTHGLGTRDVHVTVYSASGDYATVICDVQRSSSLNDIKLIFANPPATNEYRVVVSK
jgi:hypothetical protein